MITLDCSRSWAVHKVVELLRDATLHTIVYGYVYFHVCVYMHAYAHNIYIYG